VKRISSIKHANWGLELLLSMQLLQLIWLEYTYTATDANGCSKSAVTISTAPAEIALLQLLLNQKCFGEKDP
jgi:hypothetical protein